MPAAASSVERRAAERISLGLQIVVHHSACGVRWTETDAMLVDLSYDGMLVRCDRMPRFDQRILVGLLYDERGLCAAWGRSVRMDGWGGFGVRFQRINEYLVGLIGELALLSPPRRADLLASAADAHIWIDAGDAI